MREAVLLVMLLAGRALAQSPGDLRPEDLRIGHWVEVRGELAPDGTFLASEVEVQPPGSAEVLIGVASRVDSPSGEFTLLGRRIRTSPKTHWQDLSLASLEGQRVKVEGHWHGAGGFSARQIATRGPGRERIGGRVDELRVTEGGLALEIMDFQVLVPRATKVQSPQPIASIPLAPEIPRELAGQLHPDQDDYIPGTLRIGRDLSFGALLEYKGEREDDFNLDDTVDHDRTKERWLAKTQLAWTPSDSFHGLVTERYEIDRFETEHGSDSGGGRPHLDNLWGYWSDAWDSGFDLQAGRQDFQDAREWLYNRHLDALRLVWARPGVRLELSASRTLDDGTDRDLHTDNLIAYLSNGDRARELAAYVIDRRDDRIPRDYPIHFGVRALGAWIPQNKSWAEASLLRGYSNDVNLRAYAFDIGSTWSPPSLSPLSFTAGFALASGDDAGTPDVDESFRQTGLQHNNGKWAGVTSFRYYGEVFDPELSNLSILTLGLGARVAPKTSVDLVWHRYAELEAAALLRDSNLKTSPDGIHTDLGQEIDLVLGTKIVHGWDFEIVLGRFSPADAFPEGDDAWLATFQVRFRF